MIPNLLRKLFNSPTLMTWGSFFTRSVSLVIVIPILLKLLSTEEIAVWFLFATILALQSIVDMGFTPTFTRVFAYGFSGVQIKNLNKENKEGTGTPDWVTIRYIIQTANYIFQRLGFIWLLGIITIGTLSVYKHISFLNDPTDGWIAWIIIVLCSFFIIRANKYVAVLQGINKVALLRKWEMITSFGASITMIIAVILFQNLIAIVFAHQIWQIINIARNRMLINKGGIPEIKNEIINKKIPEVFDVVWPSAWRSGLGILMSAGLIQLSGIYFAQRYSSEETAKLLLTIRLIQTLVQFSQAPFYSKLPFFSILFATNKHSELVRTIQMRMSYSYLSYTIPFIILFFFGDYSFKIIGSRIDFPDTLLWMLFGLSFFFERYGAMHIQVYSLTNKIIWHIANGISGIIFVFLVFVFENSLKIYTIPISLLLANILFYTWFSSLHSYKLIKENFFVFERKASFITFLIMIFLSVYSFYKYF